MKNIKLIATDLDGTILHNSKIANQQDIDALIQLQQQGYLLTIVTGQSYDTAVKIARTLKIDQHLNKIICQNGAYITSVDHFEPTNLELIDQEIIKELIAYFNEHKLVFQMLKYDEFDTIYFNDIETKISIKSQQPKKFVDVNQMQVFSGMSHLWISMPAVGYENYFDNLKLQYQDKLTIVSSYNDEHTKLVYLISSIKANKGDKLIELAEQLKISPNQILGFGDGGNDVLMFEKIGYGIAMGHAQDYVKKSAYAITDTHLESGVANFIKLHF